MPKRLSISGKLHRAKTTEERVKLFKEWLNAWINEHNVLNRRLGMAIDKDDYDLMCKTSGELKGLGAKKFQALTTVVDIIADGNDTGSQVLIEDGEPYVVMSRKEIEERIGYLVSLLAENGKPTMEVNLGLSQDQVKVLKNA